MTQEITNAILLLDTPNPFFVATGGTASYGSAGLSVLQPGIVNRAAANIANIFSPPGSIALLSQASAGTLLLEQATQLSYLSSGRRSSPISLAKGSLHTQKHLDSDGRSAFDFSRSALAFTKASHAASGNSPRSQRATLNIAA